MLKIKFEGLKKNLSHTGLLRSQSTDHRNLPTSFNQHSLPSETSQWIFEARLRTTETDLHRSADLRTSLLCSRSPTPAEIECDGWNSIAGPVDQDPPNQVEIHAPEFSYGPPPSDDFLGDGHQQISGGDIGLQLPRLNPGPSFNSDLNLYGGLEQRKGNS
nr:uncharacterized protein LOC115253894 [Aedes albopictus]